MNKNKNILKIYRPNSISVMSSKRVTMRSCHDVIKLITLTASFQTLCNSGSDANASRCVVESII